MEAEVRLLSSHGHTVETFLRHNDAIQEMSDAKAAVQTFFGSNARTEFEDTLRSFAPDIVHVHNTFPLISPAIYWVADRLRIPIVQTLHNFRLLCPQASFLRDGKICVDCLGKVPWRGAVRGCYRDSKRQSTVLAGMVTLHRAAGTWQNKVTRYIALNEFCRAKFIAGGLPEKKIFIKPNVVDFEPPENMERAGFLFVGRLSVEKGVDVLAAAAALLPDPQLCIVGDGPKAASLNGLRGVQRLGALAPLRVKHEMNRAAAVVIPSICYETFSMVVVEAFATGTPVIASRIEVLQNQVIQGVTGLLFETGNAQDLARQIAWAQQHPQQMAEMGRNARAFYEVEYPAERNYRQLMAIYHDAITEVAARPAHGGGLSC